MKRILIIVFSFVTVLFALAKWFEKNKDRFHFEIRVADDWNQIWDKINKKEIEKKKIEE